MAQDSMEIQVHNGPPPFLLYQLQAASKPRPTQDEQEMHFFFFLQKMAMPLQKLFQAPCRDGPQSWMEHGPTTAPCPHPSGRQPSQCNHCPDGQEWQEGHLC